MGHMRRHHTNDGGTVSQRRSQVKAGGNNSSFLDSCFEHDVSDDCIDVRFGDHELGLHANPANVGGAQDHETHALGADSILEYHPLH